MPSFDMVTHSSDRLHARSRPYVPPYPSGPGSGADVMDTVDAVIAFVE